MSKKNKHNHQSLATSGSTAALSHTQEYRIIKHDLIKVVVLNAIYLVALLALYYSDQHTHYLETWFSHILHF